MTIETLSNEARMWGLPGAAYDGISFGLSDTISHAVQLLWPRSGEAVLDIGTGTGWASRLAAQRGAKVTGIDIAPGLLEAAELLAEGCDPRPQYQCAAAEALPFHDASFDAVISTYGVIFSQDPETAVSEMARVLRPGGRLVLATWASDPGGYIDRFFELLGEWSDAPPPPADPFDWGRPEWLQSTLAPFFEVHSARQTTTLYAPDTATVRAEYLKGFGPVKATHDALGPDQQSAFMEAFEALHAAYETNLGLVIPRQAYLVRAIRR